MTNLACASGFNGPYAKRIKRDRGQYNRRERHKSVSARFSGLLPPECGKEARLVRAREIIAGDSAIPEQPW